MYDYMFTMHNALIIFVHVKRTFTLYCRLSQTRAVALLLITQWFIWFIRTHTHRAIKKKIFRFSLQQNFIFIPITKDMIWHASFLWISLSVCVFWQTHQKSLLQPKPYHVHLLQYLIPNLHIALIFYVTYFVKKYLLLFLFCLFHKPDTITISIPTL